MVARAYRTQSIQKNIRMVISDMDFFMVSPCSRVKAQYTYDDLGCLSAVVDEAGNTALYTTMPSGTSSRLIAPSNTVTFNGTTATVVSSTAYAIICGDSTIASAGLMAES